MIVAAAMVLVTSTPAAVRADLRPRTVDDFRVYAERVEERFRREVAGDDRFHRFDYVPAGRQERILQALRRGDVYVSSDYVVRDERGTALDHAEGGRIHHWYAAVLVPGVTLDEVLRLATAYDRHARIYAPDIIASRTERHDPADDVYQVYYRLQSRSAWVTATLDTAHRVRYERPSADRAYALSRSIRVQQVNNPGPDETINPPGVGRGYMWATNSYWRYREAAEGVHIELESLTLTSDPWIVRIPPFRGFVRNLPRNVLTRMLSATRRSLLGTEAPL